MKNILSDKIGANNIFEENVFISAEAVIGSGNIFKSGTVIHGNVRIGNDNLFSNYVVIGPQGEMGLKGDVIPENGVVEIGDNNKIREFVVIGFPAKTLLTKVGNNNYLMARSHVPHDCRLGNSIVMAPNSALGGGTHLHDHVFLGLNAAVHHGKKIGEGCMIAMQAAISKSVPPFMKVGGAPARIFGVNRIGAERRGLAATMIDELEENLEAVLSLKYKSDENDMIQAIQKFLSENDCLIKIV